MYLYVCVCVSFQIRKYMKNLSYNDNKEKIIRVLIRLLCLLWQTHKNKTKKLLRSCFFFLPNCSEEDAITYICEYTEKEISVRSFCNHTRVGGAVWLLHQEEKSCCIGLYCSLLADFVQHTGLSAFSGVDNN